MTNERLIYFWEKRLRENPWYEGIQIGFDQEDGPLYFLIRYWEPES